MKSSVFFLLTLLSLFALGNSQTASGQQAEANPHNLPDGLYSEISTPKGIIVCELYYKKTPMTVASYVGLAEGTLGPEPRKPFYETSAFHRVVPGFVAQGGAAQPNGRGGSGYRFPDEIVPGLRHDSMGVLQMANGGPDTNGSQNCLMLGPAQRLNYLHTVFGRVVRGIEVLPKIQQGDAMKVKILRLGADAQAFKADEETFKALVAKAKPYSGPRNFGPDTFFDDPDGLLPTMIPRAQHFCFKLANFERFTGGRIIARVLAKTPDDAKGEALEKYLQGLAEKMNVAKSGALVVYFADQDRWHVRVGPESAARFIAGPRQAEGMAQSIAKGPSGREKNLDQAIQEFLGAAKEQADGLIASATKSATTDQPLAASQKLKLQVDATLDELIFWLEPMALAAR